MNVFSKPSRSSSRKSSGRPPELFPKYGFHARSSSRNMGLCPGLFPKQGVLLARFLSSTSPASPASSSPICCWPSRTKKNSNNKNTHTPCYVSSTHSSKMDGPVENGRGGESPISALEFLISKSLLMFSHLMLRVQLRSSRLLSSVFLQIYTIGYRNDPSHVRYFFKQEIPSCHSQSPQSSQHLLETRISLQHFGSAPN